VTLNKGMTQSTCSFGEALQKALAVRPQDTTASMVGMTKIGPNEYVAVSYEPSTGRMSGCCDVYVAPEPSVVARNAAKTVRATRLPGEVTTWSVLRSGVRRALDAVRRGGEIDLDIIEAGAH